ncbi:MAG: hypothetical protein ACYDAY_03790 [Candidatus Dormibacteria bacterium]
MRTFRSRRAPGSPALLAVLLAPILAQMGHGLGYSLRYGLGAYGERVQAAHSYFPLLLKVCLEGAGALALMALLVLAAARIIGIRASERKVPFEPGAQVLILLGGQLLVFAVQELVEAYLGGYGLGSPWDFALFAVAAQAPVAILAGFALTALAPRVRAAVAQIVAAVRRATSDRVSAAAPAIVGRIADQTVTRTWFIGFGLSRRGPPLPSPN